MVKKTLIVIIDALGYDLMKKSSFSLDLEADPIRLIPPYGYGEAAVMWSGEPPEKTGRWNEFKYSPEHSPFRWTRVLPLGLVDTLREKSPSKASSYLDFVTRKVIEVISAKVSPISSPITYKIPFSKLRYFYPVHDWETHKFSFLNGCKTFFGILAEKKIKYCYLGYPESRSDYDTYGKSKNALKEYEVVVSFFSELDSIEHEHGKESREVNKKLSELNGYVNELVTLFKEKNPEGNVIIFSDHGMKKVEKTIDLRCEVEETGLKDGADYICFYDATMARFWFFDRVSEIKIRGKLKTIDEGKILEENDLRRFGLNFKTRMFGDLIFAVNKGIMIWPNYFQSRTLFREMHGYCPPSPDEHGFFITDRKGMKLDHEMRMEDLLDIMLKIISVKHQR